MDVTAVVSMRVIAQTIFGSATKVDVPVVVLPLHVVMVQHRPYHGEEHGVQGNNNAESKQPRHSYLRPRRCSAVQVFPAGFAAGT